MHWSYGLKIEIHVYREVIKMSLEIKKILPINKSVTTNAAAILELIFGRRFVFNVRK